MYQRPPYRCVEAESCWDIFFFLLVYLISDLYADPNQTVGVYVCYSATEIHTKLNEKTSVTYLA